MGLKTVRVYKNTGFNSAGDIPAVPSVLDNASYTDYPDFYYLRESVDLPVIRIKENYDNLADVDYVRITDNITGKNYYYFAVPKSLSHGVTAIGLMLDALLTMGGAENQTYSGGWMTRGHIPKSEDTLFANIAPEDFTPSRPLIIDKWQELPTTNTQADDIDVVISNIDLVELGNSPDLEATVIEGFVTGATDPSMYLPYIKIASTGSDFRVWDYDAGANKNFIIPNTAAYDKSAAKVISGISKLYSFGQLQLGAAYQIPAEWYQSKAETSDGLISQIIGWHEEINLSQAPYEYISNIKNKKCFALFRTAHLLSLATGDTAAFPIYDTLGFEQGQMIPNPRVRTWADPSSTGKPYAGFVDLHKGTSGTGIPHAYCDAVSGSQWANSQIVVEGASGSAWNSLNAAFSRAGISRDMEMAQRQNFLAAQDIRGRAELMVAMAPQQGAQEAGGILKAASPVFSLFGSDGYSSVDAGSAASLVPNVTSAALQIAVNDAQNSYKAGQLEREANLNSLQAELLRSGHMAEINQNEVGRLKGNISAPSVMFTPDINRGLYGYNRFAYYETCMSVEDVLEADRYFQRFGYAGLHKPLTASCFTSRQYYNFVQASGINIKTQGYGMRIRQRAIAQLNAGVRVWHVLPDSSYYDLN